MQWVQGYKKTKNKTQKTNYKPACCAQRPSLYGRQVIFNNQITIFKTTIAFAQVLLTIYYETDI